MKKLDSHTSQNAFKTIITYFVYAIVILILTGIVAGLAKLIVGIIV